MENTANDNAAMAHIKKLTAKEESLYRNGDFSDEDVKELHHIKTELDQYWDLLHQRRAIRNAGEDPKGAEIRSAETINNYVK